MDSIIEVVANLLRLRGDDFHVCSSQFQSFQPFKASRQFNVQRFNVQSRSQAGSKPSKVPVVPIVPLHSRKQNQETSKTLAA